MAQPKVVFIFTFIKKWITTILRHEIVFVVFFSSDTYQPKAPTLNLQMPSGHIFLSDSVGDDLRMVIVNSGDVKEHGTGPLCIGDRNALLETAPYPLERCRMIIEYQERP